MHEETKTLDSELCVQSREATVTPRWHQAANSESTHPKSYFKACNPQNLDRSTEWELSTSFGKAPSSLSDDNS
jgi:hypothetical protein